MSPSQTATRPRRPSRTDPPPPNRRRRRAAGKKAAPARAYASRPAVLVTTGVVWAVLLIVGVSVATWTAALVVTPVAVVASASSMPKRRTRRRTVPVVTLAGLAISVVLPAVALAGPVAAIAVTALAAGAVGVLLFSNRVPAADPLRSLVAATGPGVAAMSVVVARGQGLNEAVVLVASACAYDMAAFLMGNSRSALGGPFGVLAGWVSMGVVGLYATAVMDPPFTGGKTIAMFAVLGVLAPLGVVLAGWLAGSSRVPALRRLDSLLLAAPAWVLGVAFVLHH